MSAARQPEGGGEPATPTRGLSRIGDLLVGPGASAGERATAYTTAFAGVLLTSGLALLSEAPWAVWQYAVVALVAFDMFGGATANATDAARRWWHRPGRTARHHLGFVAVHLQPFVLAWLVPGYGWAAAAGTYALALLGAVAVVGAPARLRRPVAFGVVAVAIAVASCLPGVAAELAWFAPVLLVKLLLSHLLPDGGRA